jgi:hypothetical protein
MIGERIIGERMIEEYERSSMKDRKVQDRGPKGGGIEGDRNRGRKETMPMPMPMMKLNVDVYFRHKFDLCTGLVNMQHDAASAQGNTISYCES